MGVLETGKVAELCEGEMQDRERLRLVGKSCPIVIAIVEGIRVGYMECESSEKDT